MAPYLGNGNEPADSLDPGLHEIHCSGSPYEIGNQHGSSAKLQISRTIEFYAGLFQENSKMPWERVREVAMTYEPVIREKWPHYLEEMKGVADGAAVDLSDIIACNVRTEIAFGLFSDGCTALSWLTDEGSSFLAQNWDWQEAQKQNLVVLVIDQQRQDKPTIKMVTEAGIIGKIGINSAGVGVCLNAIRVKGMDPLRLPCHLGLRMVLDSHSREEAVQQLEKYGIASACHMLIADATGGIGLEWSYRDVQKCTMNPTKQVFHSNHYLLEHPVEDSSEAWLRDSTYRVKRIEQLAGEVEGPVNKETIFDMFKDEGNYPGSICRTQKHPVSFAATLFNIVMDLTSRTATVTLGKPNHPEGSIELRF